MNLAIARWIASNLSFLTILFCDKRRERIMRRTRHDTTSRRAYDLSETEAQILRVTRRGRWTHKTNKYRKSSLAMLVTNVTNIWLCKARHLGAE